MTIKDPQRKALITITSRPNNAHSIFASVQIIERCQSTGSCNEDSLNAPGGLNVEGGQRSRCSKLAKVHRFLAFFFCLLSSVVCWWGLQHKLSNPSRRQPDVYHLENSGEGVVFLHLNIVCRVRRAQLLRVNFVTFGKDLLPCSPVMWRCDQPRHCRDPPQCKRLLARRLLQIDPR